MLTLCDARAMRKPIATLFMALAAAPAWTADSPAAAVEKIVACADIQSAVARLDCFDREVAPFTRRPTGSTARATPTPMPAPIPAPIPPDTPIVSSAPVTRPSFGEEQLAPEHRREASEQSLQATITSLRAVGATTFLVTLDNGQVWRHEDAHLGSFLRVGEAITVRKGSLGSYRLTRDAGATRNWIRITRVR
jgi:hypothetical protein